MASLSSIHYAIARLQAVSPSPLPPELICIGQLRCPLERKLLANTHFKKLPPTSCSVHSASRPKLLIFATTAGQDTATSTLVVQEVDFVWKGEGAQVLLTGDFLGWETKLSLSKSADGAFHCKQKLSPGTYNYKYIIDGEWAHSPDSPMIEDGKGGFNNQITVTEASAASANMPNSKPAVEGPSVIASAKGVAESSPTAKDATKSPAAAKVSMDVEGLPKAASKPMPADDDEGSPKAAPKPTPASDVESLSKAARNPTPAIDVESSPKAAPKPTPASDVESSSKAAPKPAPAVDVEGSPKAAPKPTPASDVESSSKAALKPTPAVDVEGFPKAAPKPTPASDVESSSKAAPKPTPASDVESSSKAAPEPTPAAVVEGSTKAASKPTPAADVTGSPKAAPKPTPAASKPPSAAKPGAAKPAKKAVDKPYPQIISEDVIPKIKTNLQKEQDISDVNLVFQDNQLEGSFMKKGIIYTFWAFFPDGKLEGSRGFSLSSHGAPPSTVEPFLVDEKKITADLLVFWVMKRLFTQNLLSLN